MKTVLNMKHSAQLEVVLKLDKDLFKLITKQTILYLMKPNDSINKEKE